MAEKDDWNSVYSNIMPLAGLLVSSVGLAIAILTLVGSRSQAAGVGGREPVPVAYGLAVEVPRVHYQDGRAFVEVRNPGEWHDIRDFVQPYNPDVIRMARMVTYG